MTVREGVEIERKFLVAETPDGFDGCESSAIRQGYLAVADEGAEVRVRERDGHSTLTVKRGEGMVHDEEEIDIGADDFRRLWRLTDGRRVEKRRHLVPHGDLTIEVDVYSGSLDGLVIAEVEFPSEADAEEFEPPGWLGEELTGDPRFRTQRLAVDGRPDG